MSRECQDNIARPRQSHFAQMTKEYGSLDWSRRAEEVRLLEGILQNVFLRTLTGTNDDLGKAKMRLDKMDAIIILDDHKTRYHTCLHNVGVFLFFIFYLFCVP